MVRRNKCVSLFSLWFDCSFLQHLSQLKRFFCHYLGQGLGVGLHRAMHSLDGIGDLAGRFTIRYNDDGEEIWYYGYVEARLDILHGIYKLYKEGRP